MDAKRVSPVDRRGMKCPGYKAAPVETGWRVCAATSPVHGALPCSRAIHRPAGRHEHAPVMDAKRVSPVDRRGMKCPGYKAAPVETGWRVGATASPVHGALPCSRAIASPGGPSHEHAPVMDAQRVSPVDRRGMKCPGYKAAPVETGWRVGATASPVDGALPCSRAIYRPAGRHEHALVMDAKRVSPVDRRGMKCPGYKAAPVETGWRVGATASPVDGALPCSRAIHRPAGRHEHAPVMDAKRVSPVDRRGMKCPGYKAAPVETGWRVGATASPVDGALPCSRAIHRPAGRHEHAPIMDAQRVSPVDRRGMKCPGYKAAPVETG
ncbi:MAG: hypothetical protein V9H69_20940 [Anaerolineae bacterium]